MSEELTYIEIAKIRADSDIQVRETIDESTVATYHERMLAGDAFPSVVLFDDGQTLWLADGFHRVEAAKRAGLPSAAAQVFQGSRDDAAWYALEANRSNGLPLNNADKVRAVKLALTMRPHESNRLIADHIGVSDHTVAKYRKELESIAQIAQCSTRQTSDGRQYPASRKSDIPPIPPPPPPPACAETLPPPPPPAPQPTPSESKPETPRDIPPPPAMTPPAAR